MELRAMGVEGGDPTFTGAGSVASGTWSGVFIGVGSVSSVAWPGAFIGAGSVPSGPWSGAFIGAGSVPSGPWSGVFIGAGFGTLMYLGLLCGHCGGLLRCLRGLGGTVY